MTKLIQNRVRPLLTPMAITKEESAASVVEQVNNVLVKEIDDNNQRLEIWANRVLAISHGFLYMGG